MSPQHPPGRRPSRPAPSTRGKNTRTPARGRAVAPAAAKRHFPIALVVGIALALGLVGVIVLTVGTGSGDGPLEVGTPAVTGEALSAFSPEGVDPAVGLPIPEAAGADFDGAAVDIARDGRAKAILFIAHWCSVCQREVPLIVDWLPGAEIPGNVDLYTVSTGVDRNQANYPPSEWLTTEGWTLPVLLDDEARTVARTFGLAAYPYWVFVDADGNVYQRAQGYMTMEDLESRLAALSEG